MWRCRKCFKLSMNFVIPYGRCSFCDGELQIFGNAGTPEAARVCAIREAVQTVLDVFLFYKLARDQSRHWDQRAIMERLCESEMAVLHELEKQYHPHLEPRLLDPPIEDQDRMTQRLFRGICLSDHSAVRDLYNAAIEMERRTSSHFRAVATHLPDCPEKAMLVGLAIRDDRLALIDAEVGLLAQAVAV